MSTLLGIPAEIQISIANVCPTPDLKRLCETCRLLFNRLLPELYRDVDLSSHNDDIACESWGYNASEQGVPPTFFERYIDDFDKDIFAKQEQFIETIQSKAELGEHVRSLRWTVLNTSGHYYGHPERSDADAEGEDEVVQRSLYILEDEPMWQTFYRLVNVTEVDMCWVRAWREVTLPHTLFPSATSVRLSGCMSREFAACVLHTQLPGDLNLTRIELNDVSQWSETVPALPKLRQLRGLQVYMQDHEQNHTWVPESRKMIDTLDPLIGRCPHLTSLRLTVLGPCTNLGTDSREERLYRSYARFLDSVRTTLRKFLFEQGYSHNEQAVSHIRTLENYKSFPGQWIRSLRSISFQCCWKARGHALIRMDIRGVGQARKEFEQDRDTPPTEVDGNAGIVEYRKANCGYEMIAIGMLSATEMQQKLQETDPQAIIVVNEDGNQDFESFIEADLGIFNDSRWRGL